MCTIKILSTRTSEDTNSAQTFVLLFNLRYSKIFSSDGTRISVPPFHDFPLQPAYGFLYPLGFKMLFSLCGNLAL